jgi:P-type Ca2+ transporter type 2C
VTAGSLLATIGGVPEPQPVRGLTAEEAAQRLRTYGPNRLPPAARTSLVRRVIHQFASPLIYLLMLAVVFDVVTTLRDAGGWPVEGSVIAAVLAFNAALGVMQEYRAEAALAQLEKLASPLAWATRDGELVHVAADELVPGDLVRVEAGERIPADGVFREVSAVMVDESILTGESVRVEKTERARALSGTLVVRGHGFIEVNATGPASTMGKLATALESIHVDPTPLERQLAKLGGQLARWVGLIALGLAVAGIAAEGFARFEDVALFAIALAVAAVPEGMPAVVTLTLSLGVQRMAKRKAVVRRLSAVEALGSVTVIATDKTGTLTENHMTVQELVATDELEALTAIVLANDADVGSAAGDPLELALFEHARRRGIDPAALRERSPRVSSIPFDSAWRFMRVTVERAGASRSYLKGAPEVLLERARLTDAERASWRARVERAAQRGQRVLALAAADGERDDELDFLGLALLWDPPRAEVPDAVAQAQQAGVRVLMITGDHPATALEIARQIGIAAPTAAAGADLEPMTPEQLRDAVRHTNVFARVTPEQKLAIVDALKANGEIVAVTGDGVNDAPALKRSDVGIAMGQRGSDVAREVADLVLLDDNFATLVAAMEEGRNIFENIQTFLRFTFSTNIALVLLIVAGAVGSYVEDLRTAGGMLFVPLTALQILWINFLGDGPPGLVLAVDRNAGVMARPPRSSRALLDGRSLRFIFTSGIFKAALGITALIVMPIVGFTLVAVQTVIFQTEAIGKLVSTYTARGLTAHATRNIALHVAVAAGIALQLVTMAVAPLRDLLDLESIDVRAAIAVTLLVVSAVGGQRLLVWLFGRRARVGGLQHA